MDAFESVIATILDRDGFWVRTSYKVALTKAEKREINRPSSPRWELDVVAYRPLDNVLWIVECKSYLDSRGVSFKGLDPDTGGSSRYKLFNEPNTRAVVFRRLIQQLTESKSIRPDPDIKLCLAAGNIVTSDAGRIKTLFDSNDWLLFDREWITQRLLLLAADGYDNAVASVTAKLLLRPAT